MTQDDLQNLEKFVKSNFSKEDMKTFEGLARKELGDEFIDSLDGGKGTSILIPNYS